MNVHVAEPRLAFEGPTEVAPAAHRWTVHDVRAMVDAGVIEEDAPLELIDGVLYDMPADGRRTVNWSVAIMRWLIESLSHDYAVVPDKSVTLSDYDAPKPDYWVFPDGMQVEDLTGPDLLLVVEQSDTTLGYDLGRKAELYARFGVRDYWVIDVAARQVHVHRQPTRDGYADTPPPFEADQAVEALLIPGLTLRLSDLSRVN